MRLLIAMILASLATLFFSGQTRIQPGKLQRDLTALTKRGFTYRMLDNDLIELTDPARHCETPQEFARAK